jgi:rRNA maturation RNase YbeY
MAITFDSENIEFPNLKKRETSTWIKNIANSFSKKLGDVAYLFCNDNKILDINRQYLNHDFYTDIITFDYSEGDKISGDIFISLDTVKTNSQKYNTDYQEELYRVIIHGVLHLCGLDDKSEADSIEMREAEDRALKQLFNN